MGIKKLKYILRQAFQGLWRNRVMGLAAISSVTAVLVILGLVLLLTLNVSSISLATKEKFDEIIVYLDKDLKNEQINNIGNEIRDIDGVLSAVYQSKEYALEQMKKQWGEYGDLLDGLENNPLPNSYIIQLESVDYSDYVIERLENYSGVEEIKYFKDVIEKLSSIANFINSSSIFFITILLLISVFIISNTVKITVVSRKKEIELMQYIGASNDFVRGPFVIEGLILGLIGSAISILFVAKSYQYIINYINKTFYPMFSIELVNLSIIINDIAIIFLTIGVGIGILGSLVSLKKFLSV